MYFVLAYNGAKTVKQWQTMYKTRINFRFLSKTFVSSGRSIKTKYLIYFQKILPEVQFE